MTSFKPVDIDEARRKRDQDDGKPRPKGRLPYLPAREAPVSRWKEWLTDALQPPKGHRFDGFARHGLESNHPAELTFLTPEGNRRTFHFLEQGRLAKPTTLRAAITATTTGFCQPGHLTSSEAEDTWCGLCIVGQMTVEVDHRSEARDWLDSFLGITEPEERFTLTPKGRWDALQNLRSRRFERADAMEMLHGGQRWQRPVLVIDSADKKRYIRVADLLTYIRVVVGERLSYDSLYARMWELEASHSEIEQRKGKEHPHINFFCLPEPPKAEA
jgi:hypothetical protein